MRTTPRPRSRRTWPGPTTGGRVIAGKTTTARQGPPTAPIPPRRWWGRKAGRRWRRPRRGRAGRALTTTASGSVAAVFFLNDTAPTASYTLSPREALPILYSDAGCTVAAFTDTKSVTGNGDYPSAAFTANAAGTGHWRASYSGEDNNSAAGPTDRADTAEAVVGTKSRPALATTAAGAGGAGADDDGVGVGGGGFFFE